MRPPPADTADRAPVCLEVIKTGLKTYIDKTSTFNDRDCALLVYKSEGEMTVTIKLNKKLS